jgi:hypothetical protein
MKKMNLPSLNRMARAAREGKEFLPGCSGKVGYRTREEARDTARDRREKGVKKRLTVYKCMSCNKWHITSHGKG